jgi:thioesterase domain-containing protein
VRIEDMAAHYTGEIQRVQPSGPYCLAGWSLGGNIAVEVARQLRSAGEDVALLALFDSPALGRPKRLPPVERLQYRWLAVERTVRKHARHLLARKWIDRPRGALDIFTAWREAVRMDRAYRRRQPRGERIRVPTSKMRIAQDLALRRYRPEPFNGSAVLFRTKSSKDTSRRGGTLGWGHLLTGELAIYDVPGEHLTLLYPPHVETLAGYLKRHLSQAVALTTRSRTA